MGSPIHGNATTTHRIRKEIQESQESVRKLAFRLGINPKTVVYWRKRDCVEDKKSGPIGYHGVLKPEEEQLICQVRILAELPLDDLLVTLKDKIPALTRSNLLRCLTRHGLNRLPKPEKDKVEKKRFKDYEPGFFHVDISEIKLSDKKIRNLYVAIDRSTKYVYLELRDSKTNEDSIEFLNNLQEQICYKITHILTDNGSQFNYNGMNKRFKPKSLHPFIAKCKEYNIEYRATKFFHPWTNGQVEVTNRIIKDNTVRRYHYNDSDELKKHLMMFILYYNHQRTLRALRHKTPWQVILEFYEKCPERFHQNPYQKLLGLNI